MDKQIKIIKPTVIVTLGNFAMNYILKKFGLKPEKISLVHGKVFDVSNLIGNRKIIPLYHPATATHNPNIKEVLLRDFKVVKD